MIGIFDKTKCQELELILTEMLKNRQLQLQITKAKGI